MRLHHLIILVALVPACFAVKGVDLADQFTNYSCFKNSGYTFAIIRGYRSVGAVDPYGVANLKAAQSAGLTTDVYFFPCKGKISASKQVDDFLGTYGMEQENGLYGTIWIDVEYNPSSSCKWSTSDFTSNCNFLNELVSYFKSKGKSVGIYSSKYQWEDIFGSFTACSKFSSLPLWYSHYDNSASFSDYSKYSFGGWSKPAIKQYNGDQTLCGVDVDYNFY